VRRILIYTTFPRIDCRDASSGCREWSRAADRRSHSQPFPLCPRRVRLPTRGRVPVAERALKWTMSAGEPDAVFTRVVQMAETSQLDRIRSLARAVAVDVGVGPRVVGSIRRLFRSLNLWFWAIVGLPTLVAGVYYFAIASDLYLSEAKFVVR